MSLAHSPQIVTNGLAFYYDMSNPQKSWQGRPTINLVSNPNAAINVITDDIPQGIGGKNVTGYASYSTDYAVLTLGTTSTAATGKTFTYSLWMRSPGAQSTYLMYVFDGTGPDGGWWNFGSGTLTQQWQRYTGTVSVMTGTVQYIRIYRLNQVGTIQIAAPQFEESTFATPFVLGTRFANNNLESTPSFPSWNTLSGSSASGGTLTFASGSYNNKGGWDLYKTYSGLTAGVNYTWSALVKSGTASNLIVTMNNTSAWNTGPGEVFAGFSSTEWRRIYITGTTNTGSFNIHLGASFNNDLQNIVQTGGTIFIQDVSLRLTNSQTTISDVTGNNSAIAGNLVYNSDGTFQFSYANPSYIQIPNSFLNKTEGTMNFWVYPTRYNGGNGYFVNREDSTANATDWFWIGPYSDSFYFRLGNGSDCCSNDLSFGSVSSVIPLNTWTNMCFTWKINGTSAIYKNGALYTSRSIGNIPNTNPASNGRIGLGHGNADDYFNGIMPIVSIYNRQLSANEINQNFNAQRGRYGI